VEEICGKRCVALDREELLRRACGYREVVIDLGTGDGRYVRQIARDHPELFAIGVDACRENLREVSRRVPSNVLYVIADALALPGELAGLATRITINFPWGSLLRGLLYGDAGLLAGLQTITQLQPAARLDIRLNDSALASVGWPLRDGAVRIEAMLRAAGFAPDPAIVLDSAALRACQTTWAKRLTHGDTGRALQIRGHVGRQAAFR
jgi:16S rRNA (adenine(1408)-N(1))-methyltransferase